MTYSARVLADSISPASIRITTLEVTMPRIILSEFNTHRMFSRNSASSRAIPVTKQIERIKSNPFVPEVFEENISGMQGGNELDETGQIRARVAWLTGSERAIEVAKALVHAGVHKQWASRVLEPYMWQTVIVTATEWSNFFKLRLAPEAQPEIRRVARQIKWALEESQPKQIDQMEWHLPMVEERDWDELVDSQHVRVDYAMRMISAGRCARVSYLTHDGRRDINEDYELACRLQSNGHWSPFEHQAYPLLYSGDFDANFRGWRQFRSDLERPNNVVSILSATKTRKHN